MKNLIEILKALSDETRLRIMKLLETRSELCVCEIMQALELTQSRASRNLGVLKKAGLIDDRREGQWVYYHLEASGDYVIGLNDSLKTWLNQDQTVKSDRQRLSKAVKLSRVEQCRKSEIKK